LMRLMGLVAIYQRPNTSKAAPEHAKYPYLLGGLTIDRANQVWCSDVTYIPMAKGFIYLVAIMDWHSRAVLAWRISNTLHADFCVDALEEALRRFGKPEIFNTDQGSQGGFKRSSQHFDRGGCDEEAEAAFGSVRAGCSSVARSALRGAT
jgi:putative transposase